jgi:hypothetical protein
LVESLQVLDIINPTPTNKETKKMDKEDAFDLRTKGNQVAEKLIDLILNLLTDDCPDDCPATLFYELRAALEEAGFPGAAKTLSDQVDATRHFAYFRGEFAETSTLSGATILNGDYESR